MNMRINRTFSFDAAHRLPWHSGKCQNLHGHTYRLEVSVSGPINADGIILDFADLDAQVRSLIVNRYDHQYLNDHFDNPTAELLAMSFFKQLEASGLAVDELTLWETANSSATVRRD